MMTDGAARMRPAVVVCCVAIPCRPLPFRPFRRPPRGSPAFASGAPSLSASPVLLPPSREREGGGDGEDAPLPAALRQDTRRESGGESIGATWGSPPSSSPP